MMLINDFNRVLNKKQIIEKAEDFAETVFKYSKVHLRTIARLCLISGFIEDAIRLVYHFEHRGDYIARMWGASPFFGALLILVYTFLQVGTCIFIMARKYVNYSVYVLMGVLFTQMFIYNSFWVLSLILRTLTQVGGLILLLIENLPESKPVFTGLPTLDEQKITAKSYVQLLGRILMGFMFWTVMPYEWNFLKIVGGAIVGSLICLFIIGYKTKLSALALVSILVVYNFYFHPFFVYPWNEPKFMIYKYFFFQILTAIGGLLFLVAVGPGGVSIDEKKKDW